MQIGSPVWRAGKKTFALLHADRADVRSASSRAARNTDTSGTAAGSGRAAKRRSRARLQLYFWVGVAAQGLMTSDERFEIPAYLGHQGWIALDVTEHCDWAEVRGLAIASYRHFALQRMLKALDAPVRGQSGSKVREGRECKRRAEVCAGRFAIASRRPPRLRGSGGADAASR